MKGFCSVALLVLSAGSAIAQPMECNLSTSDGTPFPVPIFFVLDHPNRRAVGRDGTVFALEAEEHRYRLSRRQADGSALALVISRDTGFEAWGITGGSKPTAGLLRRFRAPRRL